MNPKKTGDLKDLDFKYYYPAATEAVMKLSY